MEIHWYQLLFQIVNFAVLLFVLKVFLYKPIIKVIEQRNKKITDSIKAAEETLQEKAKIEALKKLAEEEAEKQAVIIVDKAKKQAEKQGKSIINQAKQEAELEVDKKLKSLTESLAEQEQEIKTQIADMVVKTTKQVLKDTLSTKEQKTIIDKEIKHLAKLK